jgi:polyisoprenoid-binding protein YceI
VIGANSEISGEIQVDFTAPQQAQVGPIEIGAGGFATDSGLRDQSIRTFILQTNRFPTINFVPTEIIGVPDHVSAGDTMKLQISGDLTIHGVTKTVTFDAHVTMVSDQELIGSASTAILRTDFGLEIPNVPRVAGVEELVNLEIDFVAVAG